MHGKLKFFALSAGVFLLALTPATIHAVRGVKPVNANGGLISFPDCKYPTSNVFTFEFEKGPPVSPPANYFRMVPNNGGSVDVLISSFDPTHTVDLSSGVVMADNLGNYGVFDANDPNKPGIAEAMPGSLGLEWLEHRDRDVILDLDCQDCPYGKIETIVVQRTWHEIYLIWDSADSNHHVTTDNLEEHAIPARQIVIEDNHVSGRTHRTRLFLDKWEHNGHEWFGGNFVAWDGPSYAPFEFSYRQRPYDESNWEPATNGVGANVAYGYSTISGQQVGGNDWGMQSYGGTVTDFDFDVRAEAHFSSTSKWKDMACNTEKTLSLSAWTGVDLLVTDRGYVDGGQHEPDVTSEASVNLRYGNYILVWEIKVTTNCDGTDYKCPCTVHDDTNDNGFPDTP